MEKKNTVRGLIFCVIAAVVWGFAFVAQSIGAEFIGPFLLNGSRFTLGALSLIPVFLIFEKGATDKGKLKKSLIYGCIAGALLFTASFMQQIGIEMTSAGKSGFITSLYMILVPIIGIFIGKKTNIRVWIGAVLGVIGLYLICCGSGKLTFTKGDILLIGCAVFFALHILVIDKAGEDVYTLRFTAIQFAVCAIINWIFTLILEDISLSGMIAAAIPIAYCGFMSVGVAYTCQVLGLKYSDPTSASLIFATESLFSAIGGAIILHERMTGIAYVGCALIFCGIILTQIDFAAIKKKHASGAK